MWNCAWNYAYCLNSICRKLSLSVQWPTLCNISAIWPPKTACSFYHNAQLLVAGQKTPNPTCGTFSCGETHLLGVRVRVGNPARTKNQDRYRKRFCMQCTDWQILPWRRRPERTADARWHHTSAIWLHSGHTPAAKEVLFVFRLANITEISGGVRTSQDVYIVPVAKSVEGLRDSLLRYNLTIDFVSGAVVLCLKNFAGAYLIWT